MSEQQQLIAEAAVELSGVERFSVAILDSYLRGADWSLAFEAFFRTNLERFTHEIMGGKP